MECPLSVLDFPLFHGSTYFLKSLQLSSFLIDFEQSSGLISGEFVPQKCIPFIVAFADCLLFFVVFAHPLSGEV